MIQILQNIKNGNLTLEEVPVPLLLNNGCIVETRSSLISVGTEKMLMDLASKSYLGKAQARPDLVKKVIEKAKKDGWSNTAKNLLTKMEKPMPLGYSASGIIKEVGDGVASLAIGDRVAIAGAGYANHAEINYIPQNLIAKIPDNVTFDEAAYTTVGCIALQGIRNINPEIGAVVGVIGLGLIGLLTSQLLKANGCRVIGLDIDPAKLAKAKEVGINEAVLLSDSNVYSYIDKFTGGRGLDYTIITASTKENGPVETAGQITRRKGKVVIVGAVGMNIPRENYYKKELELTVSMSYGPGRYDFTYEEGNVDYPYDYVRWTEQRNMTAFLELLSSQKINVNALTSHNFAIEKSLSAYNMIKSNAEPYLGIILKYSESSEKKFIKNIVVNEQKDAVGNDKVCIGFAGAGNYASLHLLPYLQKNPDTSLIGLVNASGLTAKQKAKRYNFKYCTTDFDAIVNDNEINSIFISTRHSTHYDYIIKALQKRKHVYVEKPVVVSEEQLNSLIEQYELAGKGKEVLLMVGHNRRFSPMISEIAGIFKKIGPKQIVYRVNSGHIPNNTWLHENDEGGGMLVGEMSHFIDVMVYITGEQPKAVFTQKMSVGNSLLSDFDNIVITLEFSDGSVGVLAYNIVGDKSAPKERIEIFGGGMTGFIDDFRKMTIYQNGKSRTIKKMNQDKGQEIEMKETVKAFMKGRTSPIPFKDIVNVMRVIFAAKESLFNNKPQIIEPYL